MTRQRKFTNIKGDFNGVKNITEPESLFLPKDQRGVKTLDDDYDRIFDYDNLKSLIVESRKSFNDDIKSSISKNEIAKINSGLRDYVMSSIKRSYNLELLKASMLNALGNDFLTYNYSISDEEVKQIIPEKYFEKIDDFLNVDNCWLIKPQSIITYHEKAKFYTKKVLSEFCHNNQDYNLENSFLYRGQSNLKYYKTSLKDNSSDIISIFSGLTEPFPYFERQLLNSYTLNFLVAEKFMISKYNQRRVLITADMNSVIDNTFSSFIVSDIFVDGQYEILCLPNENELFISQDVNDAIAAEFHISKTDLKPIKIRRKHVKE